MTIKNCSIFRILPGILTGILLACSTSAEEVEPGTIQVPAFHLPPSSFLSEESKKAVREAETLWEQIKCPIDSYWGKDAKGVLVFRKCVDDYINLVLPKTTARYAVRIEPKTIQGVYTEVFTPTEGIADKNKTRILINLHGGGFVLGARTIGRLESIPFAAVGKIKVISVDYRQGPEHRFPSASEDVAAVYRELLKKYKPENIGIYGCSAGGMLTAQSVAWFQKEGLPPPGAIGMLCAAAASPFGGDFAIITDAMTPIDRNPAEAPTRFYFADEDWDSPLVLPVKSDAVLSNFPPSLLVTSTRDTAMSSVVFTHSRLTKLGVEADLHVWEGLGHGFMGNPDIPESREVYDVVVKFFDTHLGR